MLGGTSFHDNILVFGGNCSQQFVKVNKAIKQYILIPSLIALCIHAFGNFISRQFRYGPIVELSIISPCIEDGPVMCLANCVAVSVALATDHLSPPQDTTQGEQYLSRDIVVSRLRRWEWVKVVVVGQTFLIIVVCVLLDGMTMVVLILLGQVFRGEVPWNRLRANALGNHIVKM
jgi:hypothetical protein